MNGAALCPCDLPEDLCDLMGHGHTPPTPEEQGGLRSEGQQAGSLPASSVSGAGFVGPRDTHLQPG